MAIQALIQPVAIDRCRGGGKAEPATGKGPILNLIVQFIELVIEAPRLVRDEANFLKPCGDAATVGLEHGLLA